VQSSLLDTKRRRKCRCAQKNLGDTQASETYRDGKPSEIAAATDLKDSVVKVCLGRMVTDGEVIKCKRREYAHP